MKPCNARILDDLISGDDRQGAYRLVRDGRLANIAEVLAGLERRIDSEHGRDALVHFAWMLVETREPHGSDAARHRDQLAAQIAKQQETAAGPTKVRRPAPDALRSKTGRAATAAGRRRRGPARPR